MCQIKVHKVDGTLKKDYTYVRFKTQGEKEVGI
jgi:hypothetical protein